MGIRLFPWATELQLDSGEHPVVFDAIHATNYWGSEESISGSGSTKAWAKDYAAALTKLVVERGFRSMFDAPCGDVNWIGSVIAETGINYVGGDVSQLALDQARARHPELDLRLFDICRDPFPATDVWHCRDCLFHLSFADGLAALRNFARSEIQYALITTNSGLWVRNMDIITGGHRVTDLERAPYNLPRPILRLKDYPEGIEFPRYVGLWRREDVASTLL